MPMPREKTVDELMEEMERSAAALSDVPEPSEAIGDGVEAAIARHEKPMTLPEMDFSGGGQVVLPEMDFSGGTGGTDVAEQRSAAAPDVAKPPSSFSTPASERARPDVRTTATANAPPPRKGPLDWSELVDRTKRGALLDDVVNSGNSMLAQMGPPGWQFKPNMNDSSEKLARLPLEMAKEQQGMESRQLAGDAQRAKLDASAASADPNSPQSQRAREAWKTMGLPTPAGFEGWSAADVKAANAGDFTRVMQLKAQAEERERKKEEAAAKATEAAKRRTEDLDWRKTVHEDSQANAAATRALAARGLENREADKADKKTEDIPPGYEVAPDGNPGTDSRKKFTALVASQRKMKELTAAMRDELKDADLGDRLLPGAKKRRLQQLATQMRIEAKNVAELGALSGPDMGLIESIATDPTSLSSLAGGSLDANLAGLDSWADSSVRAGEKAYGLRRKQGGGTQGEQVTVVHKKTGKSKQMAKAKADALLAAPGGDAYEVR